jgi:uncharacterized protein
MIQEEVFFDNSKGMRLHGVLRFPYENAQNLPAIIICHGFMNHKDHILINYLATTLTKKGFVTLRFDFSHHGTSEGDIEDATVTKQIDDLKSAIKFMLDEGSVDSSKIGVLGHSLGGSVAIMSCIDNQNVRAIVTLNATAHINQLIDSYLSDTEMLQWRKTGSTFINGNKLNKHFLDDAEKYEVLEYAKQLNCPLLIVHGASDRRVPPLSARELLRDSNLPKDLKLIEGANHDFTAEQNREEMISLTFSWFNRFMR